MNNVDLQYNRLLTKILNEGQWKNNRTGVDCLTIAGHMFEHDMSEGFPLLTSRKLPFKSTKVELEFFIKGLTDKKWLEDRGCKYWHGWCSPNKVPYGHDEETRRKMAETRDLGPIYGYQFRFFGRPYKPLPEIKTDFNKQIIIEKSNDKLVGKEFTNSSGYKFIVISCGVSPKDTHGKRYNIKFIDSGYELKNVRKDVIKKGAVKDPYSPTVNGVACIGEPRTKLNNKLINHLYKTWSHIIDRCYNDKCKEYIYYGAESIYVEDRWLIFANFLEDVQLLEGWDEKLKNIKKYQLDKDIKRGKFYGRDTCIWIPKNKNLSHTRKNILCEAIDPNGKIYKFTNQSEFARLNGFSQKQVNSYLSKKRKNPDGWLFKYIGNKRVFNTGVDQLKNIVETLKSNPQDRRMICNSWNPLALDEMALVPCHYSWQVTVIGDKLNLAWNQRSVDVCCGLPQNIASYALLLHLLAKESGLKEGKLIGFLMDTHIYANHIEGVKKQLGQQTYNLPFIKTEKFTSIFDWEYQDTVLENYQYSDPIKYEVAV